MPHNLNEEIAKLTAEIDPLAARYDARIFAAVFLARAASMYKQLRMLGYETPESLMKLFATACNDSLEDGAPATVLNERGETVSRSRQ